jgi:hypothetical protein
MENIWRLAKVMVSEVRRKRGVSIIETNAANEWNGDERRRKKREWAGFRPIKETPVNQHIVIKIQH